MTEEEFIAMPKAWQLKMVNDTKKKIDDLCAVNQCREIAKVLKEKANDED